MNINLKTSINRVYLFGDDCPLELIANPKLVWIPSDVRPTFGDMLKYIHSLQSPVYLSIVANADIFFNEEGLNQIRDVYRRGPANIAMANSRWDVHNFVDESNFTEECLCRVDSQDYWIIKGIPTFTEAAYEFGRPGIDNKVALELNNGGYRVMNLAKSIKGYHYHVSNQRNYYVNGSAIPGYPPPYLMVEPQSLLEAGLQ